MKIKEALLLLVLSTVISSTHPFEEDMADAYVFLLKQKTELIRISECSNADRREAIAIVAPELIRWTVFQDFFEIKLQEIKYPKLGEGGYDFSIGHFQMKPSFIEDLEEYIINNKELSHLRYIVINEKRVKSARWKRLARLKDFRWQVRYAHTYWQVAKHRFSMIPFQSSEERVHFFASAYNLGFKSTHQEIRKWQTMSRFPFGKKYTSEQVKYGDLSVEFYLKYSNNLHK